MKKLTAVLLCLAVFLSLACAVSEFSVDPANSCYKSVDGVLFTKDGRYLVSYPLVSERTEYTVPEGTERICRYALSQAKNLTAIRMNEGLREIGDFAIFSSEAVTSLSLPKSLRSIGTYALTFCDGLTVIDYAGSSADWSNIEIGEMNDLLFDGSVRISCAG